MKYVFNVCMLMSYYVFFIVFKFLQYIIYCFLIFLIDNDVEVEDYVSYILSIYSFVQLLFMDECEVNVFGFLEFMYVFVDVFIILVKQSKIKENDVNISQSDIRLSYVSY